MVVVSRAGFQEYDVRGRIEEDGIDLKGEIL